jgi:ligand-binding sensor domain-containing protein/two-component sensor histidine kinase
MIPELSRSRASIRGLSGVLALLLLPCLWSSSAASALDHDQTLLQLRHRVWTASDGLYGTVYALAQTTDGYLWAGTSDGLYRFNGQRFDRYNAPSGSTPILAVDSLLGAADGSLWIGDSHGHIAHLSHGQIKIYNQADGVPVGRNRFILADADGAIWSAGTGGFVRFNGCRFESVGTNWGYPDKTADAADVDASGTLWATSEGHTFFLLHGEHSFRPVPGTTGRVLDIVPVGSRVVLVADEEWVHAYWREMPRTNPVPLPYSSRSRVILLDRDRTVWVTLTLGRLLRADDMEQAVKFLQPGSASAGLQAMTVRDGLSGLQTDAAFEDREGSIWIGTERGLDQFTRRNVVARLSSYDVDVFRVVEGPDGDVWYSPHASDSRETWTRVSDGVKIPRTFSRLINPVRAKDGTVFFLAISDYQEVGRTGHRLWHWTKSGITEIPLPRKKGDPVTAVESLTADSSSQPWVAIGDNGEWSFDGQTWYQVPAEIHDKENTAIASCADDEGDMWFLYPNHLARVEGGVIRLVRDERLPNPPFTALATDGNSLYVAGQSGISFGGTGGFRKILFPETIAPGPTSSMVASSRSGLWLSSTRGIYHFPVASLEDAKVRPLGASDVEVFSSGDLPATPETNPIEAADGRIWFGAAGAVLEIDPRLIQHNRLPPATVIESVSTRAGTFLPAESIRVAPHSGEVRINYAALSFSHPELNRFRYRLSPAISSWVEAGTSHVASFAGLAPGRYTFAVAGSNNDGVWDPAGAEVSFTILPAFYQTWWFRSLYILATAVILYLIYLLRVRTITTRVRRQTRVRYEERERIARELHDTLLGEVHGLALRIGTMIDLTPKADSLRDGLERTLSVAEQVMHSSRERVTDLRDDTTSGVVFVENVRQAGDRDAQDYPAQFVFVVSGQIPDKLNAVIAFELVRILAEAIGNAFRHSGSDRIEVLLDFSNDRVEATVRDSGKGFDPALWTARHGNHFGLVGMQERARDIGADLAVQTSGAGTTIRLKIRSRGLYRGGTSLK